MGVDLEFFTSHRPFTAAVGATPDCDLAVGIVAGDILDPNPSRVGLFLFNEGPVTAYLAWDADAVTNAGIVLDMGDSLLLNVSLISRGRLSAVTFAGTTSLCWQEMNRV